LIPMVKNQINIPLIAAGGIATGEGMHAAMVLGADGVQMGTRFALTKESSSHENFKKACLEAQEGDTYLTLKELAPVRLIRNKFFNEVQQAYAKGASIDELKELLGRARAKRGMFEGDLEEGELEIGQIVGLISEIPSVDEVMQQLITTYQSSVNRSFKI